MLQRIQEEEVGEFNRRREERNALANQREKRGDLVIRCRASNATISGGPIIEGAQACQEIVVRQLPNPLAVDPFESGAIEDGPRLLHMFQRESPLNLFHAEDLVLTPR